MESPNFSLTLIGLLLTVGAVSSSHNWNGWDVEVHQDHGLGVRTRWNLRVLVGSVGASSLVAGYIHADPMEWYARVGALATSWLLTVTAILLSRGELWRRAVPADGGKSLIWAGKYGQLRPRELTPRGRGYVCLVVLSLLASVLVVALTIAGLW